MIYYHIAGMTIESEYLLPSFEDFSCGPCEANIRLMRTEELPPAGEDIRSGSIYHRRLPNGWFFHFEDTDQQGLYVNIDYSQLRMLGEKGPDIDIWTEWFVRIALECALIRRGFVSLHSAAIEMNGKALAFTGDSGIGKSTRARAWIKAMQSDLISGDRPLIDVRNQMLYGVPWDGKEQCFRNVSFPLSAICEIRRSSSVYIRAMSFLQRRKLLTKQSFIPMWDTETAAVQMENISKLAACATIVRVFCGPSEDDARAICSQLQHGDILKEECDMKAKPGFILRHVVDEYILMPTGENITRFNGTILLNEVSAMVWEKLQNPVSKADLLKAIMDEYETDEATASDDLEVLLNKLKDYGVIEDE